MRKIYKSRSKEPLEMLAPPYAVEVVEVEDYGVCGGGGGDGDERMALQV